MPVSEATYERLALEDHEGLWELVSGVPMRRPLMTTEHDEGTARLAFHLARQLNPDDYSVRQNSGRLRSPTGNYRVPDVVVIPRSYVRRKLQIPRTFEVYEEPMPLVVELWSPSTGEIDVSDKLREYQQRGDQEIWHIHSYDRTLMAWVRQADASYVETFYTDGRDRPSFLPDVVIDLAGVFP